MKKLLDNFLTLNMESHILIEIFISINNKKIFLIYLF